MTGTRKKSHSHGKEPMLEKILGNLRYGKVINLVPSDSKVLDMGCGYNGEFLKKIRGKIDAGVGIDISVNPNFSDDKIRLISHDLNEKLPFDNEEFDVVVSLANLEHLTDPQGAIREIFRVLKHGGLLLLTTPSVYGKPVLEFLAFISLVSTEEIQDHKNYFTKKILTDLCEESGFSSCKHKYFQLGMNNFLIATK
jgi:SAM-dependent methyltransferase